MTGKFIGRRGLGMQGTALLLVAVLMAACVPSGPSPIGPRESFRGLVNGVGDGAVVTTACGGLGWEGRLGRAVSGQTVAATRDASGPGFTGDNGAVFVEANSSAQAVQLREWDVAVAFPSDVDVPCDGSGVVVFDPCFGFVGCRGGAKAHAVKVQFINIAL